MLVYKSKYNYNLNITEKMANNLSISNIFNNIVMSTTYKKYSFYTVQMLFLTSPFPTNDASRKK